MYALGFFYKAQGNFNCWEENSGRPDIDLCMKKILLFQMHIPIRGIANRLLWYAAVIKQWDNIWIQE